MEFLHNTCKIKLLYRTVTPVVPPIVKIHVAHEGLPKGWFVHEYPSLDFFILDCCIFADHYTVLFLG